jgi:hypothetical protein
LPETVTHFDVRVGHRRQTGSQGDGIVTTLLTARVTADTRNRAGDVRSLYRIDNEHT